MLTFVEPFFHALIRNGIVLEKKLVDKEMTSIDHLGQVVDGKDAHAVTPPALALVFRVPAGEASDRVYACLVFFVYLILIDLFFLLKL